MYMPRRNRQLFVAFRLARNTSLSFVCACTCVLPLQNQAPLLLQTVLDALLDLEAAAGGQDKLERAFEEAREGSVRRCRSFDVSRPDELAEYYCGLALLQVRRNLYITYVVGASCSTCC